ncbi:MAG: VWA domain-containing protein [Candidatus Brocadiaceae bacterium]|nr:VWA domain-containing protein [Candidatus Brocadiaceae bacterium]
MHRLLGQERRGGQVLVLFAVVIMLLAAICVLTIDVGRLFTCKAQLQSAVDAAALAGASQLLGIVTEDEKALALAEATALAHANTVDGEHLSLGTEDIEFGHYDPATHAFIPEAQSGIVDSVRVTGRRTDASPDGPVPLSFGPVFGWEDAQIADVVSVGTKPRRYVVFTLDRSGSMCFDTPGVQLKPTAQDPDEPQMDASPSGWYWVPHQARRRSGYYWYTQTAWFEARDDATGDVVTDFLPDHIRSRLNSNRYFNFRSSDSPNTVQSGWIKVPPGITIYGRYASPWNNWLASTYYDVISSSCGYATSTGPVQPLQDTMDAACAFVDLLRPVDDAAGLVTYASQSVTDQVLTNDFAALQTKLQALTPCGGTAEPNGMRGALDELIDSGRASGFGHKVMILLTDGCANVLNGRTYDSTTVTYQFLGESVTTEIHPTVGAAMATQTQRARNGGVRVYCVTFGNDVDTDVHRVIAEKTNAAHYYSADHSNLTDMFLDIFRRLPPIITR